MFKCKITVFTPTYNRANTLERLYKSLQNQTFRDFEWLVIDDGSSDKTSKLFENWTSQSTFFPVRYYKKSNGGKHTAINFGLDKAEGELFFTADSDDYLTIDALDKVNNWVHSLPKDNQFCGVVGNLGYSENETPNTLFKKEFVDIDLLHRYDEEGDFIIDGERAYVFFTSIHRKYKYPEFENEKFLTEAVSWNRMANDGYKMRVFNDIIYIYKFLPGGLTLSGSKLFIENPKGFALWLKEKADFCGYDPIMKMKMYYSYYISQKGRLPIREIAENIGTSSAVVFVVSVGFYCKKFYDRVLNLFLD